MNIKKLREDAIWEFNTSGMFPEAHFAFLDEIYRASDALMSSMLGVLNERTFHNGLKEMKCPLLSAIGTTNFIADRPELEAFHDRWLIRCVSHPADSSEARRRILALFMSHDPDNFTIVEPLALRELQRLQMAVRNVQLPDEFQDLYEELASKYKSNIGNSCYVSDRRYCQAYRLVQAQFLLQCCALRVEKAPPSCIAAARYGLIQEGTKEHIAAMDDATTSVIGAIERMEKEEPEIAQFEEEGARICGRYDPGMTIDRKLKMFERVSMILDKMRLMSPEEQFTLPTNIERLAKVVKRLEEVHETLKQSIN
jgi:MoxR-like ATPase